MLGAAARWRVPIYAALVLLMLLPAAAMQVTSEVDWDAVDFAVFGMLLFGAAVAFEFVVRTTSAVWIARPTSYRVGVGLALATAALLVIMNGAVGLIGDEGDPANLMYAGVLAIGAVGGLITRFHPLGLARTLALVAVAQLLAAALALVAGWGSDAPSWPVGIVTATVFFTVLWLAAAALVLASSRSREPRFDRA